jgi:hypothetical protein
MSKAAAMCALVVATGALLGRTLDGVMALLIAVLAAEFAIRLHRWHD